MRLRQAKLKAWITEPRGVEFRVAGLVMNRLCEKEWVDFRQGSPNRLRASDFRDELNHNDLLIGKVKYALGRIRDFKKQNYSSAETP